MPLIERDDSMLIIIDVQENFYPESRTDVDRAAFEILGERIAWLTGIAAASNIPIVVTEEAPNKNLHTVAEIRERLPADAPVFPKVAFGVMGNPDIAEAILATKRETVILVGLETDVCVGHSAIQLHDLGKRVVLVHNATFSPGDSHESGLSRLRNVGIETVSVKELYYDWYRSVDETRALREAHPGIVTPPPSIVL